MEISKKEYADLWFIEIKLDDIIEPKDIQNILNAFEDFDYFGKGIVISGRLPVWLYCALVHHFHPAKFVATFDPRLNGAVVVASHIKDYKVGQVIKI